MSAAGLYIHVPFCLSKCRYCSFYSVSVTDAASVSIVDYVEALLREIDLCCNNDVFDTVYFGGGTPSLLMPDQIETIKDAVIRRFNVADDAEWTFEGNPGDLTKDYCSVLRKMGFNRINIGAQSLDDHLLQWLGRRHSRRDVIRSLENVRLSGFSNLGFDLIYGIPQQSITSFLDTLREIQCFTPEHLSCYQLSIEPGTPLFHDYQNGLFSRINDETEAGFFFRTSQTLCEAGYIHYEISNFARSRALQSRHNSKYWDHSPYLGLGPAAHSFHTDRRRWNVRSLPDYCRKLKQGLLPVEDEETLSPAELQLESIALGLRTKAGIDLSKLISRITLDDQERIYREIHQLMNEGLISLSENCILPTLKGFAVADALALRLDRIIN